MKKVIITLSVLFLVQTFAFAQDLYYKDVKFQKDPQVHKLDSIYDGESSVIVQDNRIIQIYVGRKGASTYMTNHKIIQVNDDAAIERFNRVYIPLSGVDKLISIGVRTISPDGSIKLFNRKSLKKLENVDGYNDYTIFAVEGAQKGGEIEYVYTVKRGPRSFGREYFQSDVPVVESNFKLYIPDRHEFSTKSYNGFPECEEKDYSYYTATVNNIPAVTEESSSNYQSKLMRVDYKLESSGYYSDIITWESISKNLFSLLVDKRGRRQASKFLETLSLDGKSQAEQLGIVEKSLKTDFTRSNSGSEDFSDPVQVLKNKVGNRLGMAKVYIKCFERLGLEFDLVFTSSRFDGTLDKTYAHNMDLGEFLFYFPKYKKYIAPNSPHMRFSRAPSRYEGNKGLFIPVRHSRGSAPAKRGINSIKTLAFSPGKSNVQGVNAEFKLNKEMDEAIVKMENFSQGFRAFYERYYYTISDEKERQEFYENVITSAIEDAEYKSVKVENENIDFNMDPSVPFKIYTEITSNSLVQKAGNDILISIGKVIGKQTELYEEKNRISDVVFSDTKHFNHKIKVEIPNGFTVSGLEQLKVSNAIEIEGETIMSFLSDYKLNGNELEITINETYEVLELDKEYYNEYRKVINSAADFNKVVLVLEPSTQSRN